MFLIRRAFRLAVVIATSLSIAVLATPASAGSRADTGSFPIEDHFIDEGSSEACGFDVHVDLVGVLRYEIRLDANGDAVAGTIQLIREGTVSGNGVVLSEMDRDIHHLDLTSDAQRDVGIVFKISVPGGGAPVLFDRGYIEVAADGSLVRVSGPHPALEGDVDALCSALGG